MADPAGGVPGGGYGSVWRDGQFLRLWTASTISAFGDFFTVFALPLLVFLTTGSALLTGLTLTAETVPYVVVSPFAGVLVDRVDRRRILIATRVAQFFLIGSIPLASAVGILGMPQVLTVAFLSGSVAVVFGAAALSAVPNLVPPEHLVAANAAQQLSFSTAAMAGPPLAGLVVALAGSPVWALAVDAVTFLLGAVLLAGISRPLQAARDSHADPSGVLFDLREGLQYVWGQPLVRTAALLLFGFNVMLGGVLGQLIVYGRAELQLADFPLSLLFAADGAGTLLAAAVAARLGRGRRMGRIVLVCLPLTALCVLVLAVAEDLVVVLLALAAFGAVQTVMFVNLISLRQRIVPDRLQGRVNATARALAVSGTPVGALIGGLLVDPLGVRGAFLVLAGLALVNSVVALATPLRNDQTRT
ncbi:MAG: MFS transporter [Geodermatophilaceae bacterium]|nr:MFS transporter [Geodermatophilaceae bacterium]